MDIIILGFLYWQFVAIVGVAAGYHRYWAHNSFKAPIWFEWVSLYLALFSGARGPLGWIGTHRMHHKFFDTKKDPHSPLHVGMLKVLTSTWSIKTIPRIFIKDVIKNPRIKFFHKYWLYIWFGSAVFFILIDYKIFLIFWLSPLIFGHIGIGLLNTLGHKNNTPSKSHIANIFTAGEGDHEYHHKYPNKYNSPILWNPGKWFIDIIKY